MTNLWHTTKRLSVHFRNAAKGHLLNELTVSDYLDLKGFLMMAAVCFYWSVGKIMQPRLRLPTLETQRNMRTKKH